MIVKPFGFFGSQAEPVTENLILWYDMDQTSSYDYYGSPTFLENIGPSAPAGDNVTFANNYDLTYATGSEVNSVTFNQVSSGDFGEAANLNNNEIADLPGSVLASTFTFEAGFYVGGALNDNVFYGVRLDQTLGGISRPGYGFRSDQFILFGVAGYPYTTATTNQLTSGFWHQIVAVGNGTNLAMYVDGQFTENITISSTRPQVQNSGGTQVVGCNVLGNSRTWVPAGTYSFNYLRIYNDKALTAGEVSQNFTSKKADLLL
jgi:hypothetical protein